VRHSQSQESISRPGERRAGTKPGHANDGGTYRACDIRAAASCGEMRAVGLDAAWGAATSAISATVSDEDELLEQEDDSLRLFDADEELPVLRSSSHLLRLLDVRKLKMPPRFFFWLA
jgi:hypothetical protein